MYNDSWKMLNLEQPLNKTEVWSDNVNVAKILSKDSEVLSTNTINSLKQC